MRGPLPQPESRLTEGEEETVEVVTVVEQELQGVESSYG